MRTIHSILYRVQEGEMNTEDALRAIAVELEQDYRAFLFQEFPYASEGSPAVDEINMFVKKLREMLNNKPL